MAQVNAGRVRFVSRGEYNNSTQYYLFDLVNYEGSSYVAIGNTLGNIPTNTTYWQLVAEKGNTGSVGPEGPQGVGIASITKTSTEGLVDTYTITYTDGTTTTFQVTNGEDGDVTPTEFNALKADVEDLRDNQIIYPSLDQPALEGTNIHVEDAAKARLYEFEMDKESTQETTTGKNLLETGVGTNIDYGITTNYYNGKFVVSGTLNSTYFSYLIKYLTQNIPAGTYTLSRTYTTINLNLRVTYIDNTMDTKYLSSGTSRTINFTQDVKRIQLFSDNLTSETTLNFTNYIQLEAGETATEWEPYTGGQPSPNPDYPQEVKTVKGSVDVKVVGKNLFDKDNYHSLMAYFTSSKIISEPQNRTIYIQCKPNTTYTVTKYKGNQFNLGTTYETPANNVEIHNFAYDASLIGTYDGSLVSLSITTDNQSKYLCVRCYQTANDTGLTYSQMLSSIQIEEGSTATSYEAYKESIVPIPLNNNELVGIGNYLDELIVDKTGHCWLNKKTSKKVLDGSEIWNIYNTTSTSVRFRTEISDIEEYKTGSSMPNLLCNRFIPETFNATWKIGNISRIIYSGFEQSVVFIYNLDTSLANWKTWLSTHNTEVYYVLATPETIDLQTTVDLKLFKGVNNITNSEDGNMRIRYVESIDTIINEIEDIKTRLSVLEEE